RCATGPDGSRRRRHRRPCRKTAAPVLPLRSRDRPLFAVDLDGAAARRRRDGRGRRAGAGGRFPAGAPQGAEGGGMSDFIALWPGAASAYSREVDLLIGAFTVLIVALSAPVFILIVVFATKYRRGKPANRRHAPDRNVWLEVSWTLVPFLLLIGFYIWSTHLFAGLYHPPAEALEIDVVAKQWMWKFKHPEGQGEINELQRPAGEPVRVVMASQDVVHSLFVPALRLKQDVVPGRYTSMWFTADTPGTYRLACAEFCGADHSVMGG